MVEGSCLTVLQCTRQTLTINNYLTQSGNSVEVENFIFSVRKDAKTIYLLFFFFNLFIYLFFKFIFMAV